MSTCAATYFLGSGGGNFRLNNLNRKGKVDYLVDQVTRCMWPCGHPWPSGPLTNPTARSPPPNQRTTVVHDSLCPYPLEREREERYREGALLSCPPSSPSSPATGRPLACFFSDELLPSSSMAVVSMSTAAGFRGGLCSGFTGDWGSTLAGAGAERALLPAWAAAPGRRRAARPARSCPSMKNVNEGKGVFAPLVVVARDVIGKKTFNQLRGKAIALHSQVAPRTFSFFPTGPDGGADRGRCAGHHGVLPHDRRGRQAAARAHPTGEEERGEARVPSLKIHLLPHPHTEDRHRDTRLSGPFFPGRASEPFHSSFQLYTTVDAIMYTIFIYFFAPEGILRPQLSEPPGSHWLTIFFFLAREIEAAWSLCQKKISSYIKDPSEREIPRKRNQNRKTGFI